MFHLGQISVRILWYWPKYGQILAKILLIDQKEEVLESLANMCIQVSVWANISGESITICKGRTHFGPTRHFISFIFHFFIHWSVGTKLHRDHPQNPNMGTACSSLCASNGPALDFEGGLGNILMRWPSKSKPGDCSLQTLCYPFSGPQFYGIYRNGMFKIA